MNFTPLEREALEAFLADNRAEVLGLLDGLTEEEEARRSLVPSLTTLLGLVKHACFAERVWFHVRLAGRTREEIGVPWDIDDSFRLAPDDTIASVSAEFRKVCAQSDRIAASYDLDHAAADENRGPVSLRWIYVHMVEELARHAGHGDILREQILAARNPG